MSARSRRLVTAGSLSLALALATPAAAFADHREEHDPKGGSSEQSERADEADESGSGSSEPEQPSSSEQRSAGSGNKDGSADKAGPGSTAGSGEKAGSGGKTGSGRSPEGRAAGGDPRGNNGTVKIDGAPFDDGRGNEPHVGCVFEVDFYGFDAGDAATITFTGHAPTGGGLLHSESKTLISNDAAGGGQDRDATLRYSVEDQLSELLAIAPHPKQGWHVKLAVDIDSAPGGAKQKVFWIDCPTPAPLSGTADEAATGGGSTDVAVTQQSVPLAPTFGSGALGVAAAPDNRLSVSARSVSRPVRTATATAGAAATAEAATVGGGRVAAQGAVRPSALPFTGAEGLAALLALGLGAVGAGALIHRFGRKGAADLA